MPSLLPSSLLPVLRIPLLRIPLHSIPAAILMPPLAHGADKTVTATKEPANAAPPQILALSPTSSSIARDTQTDLPPSEPATLMALTTPLNALVRPRPASRPTILVHSAVVPLPWLLLIFSPTHSAQAHHLLIA